MNSWKGTEVAGLLAGGLRPAQVRAILAAFTSLEAFAASTPEQRAAHGCPDPVAPVHVDLGDGWVVALTDPDYPASLAEIATAPPVLFGVGNRAALTPGVAMTGSRDADDYGLAVAAIAGEAAALGDVTLYTGFARGADTAAVRACLKAGGTTVAVLPQHPTDIYPRENADLARDVLAAGGALVSEQLPGAVTSTGIPGALAARNRLIVALGGSALVVTCAMPGSGSLRAVWDALAQRRPIVVARQRPGTRPRPGAAVPAALADPNHARLMDLRPTPPARERLAELAASGEQAASAVAADRADLALIVSTYALFSPWRSVAGQNDGETSAAA